MEDKTTVIVRVFDNYHGNSLFLTKIIEINNVVFYIRVHKKKGKGVHEQTRKRYFEHAFAGTIY